MDLAAFRAALGDVPATEDPPLVKRASRDFYWYSPVLKPQLDGKYADILVQPRDEADVLTVAASAARHGVPITARGGGTGNYGQAVPLAGGAVLDMTGLDRILWARDGVVRVQAGMKLIDLERALRPQGWELRLYPSTKRTATIGGFVAGGSGGIGSVTWGGLREAGNVIAARVVSCEATPRVIELAGSRSNLVNRTFGTTGIVTELEMPLAPAMPWRDVAVAFDDLMMAARFGHALALHQAIDKKLSAVVDGPLTGFFKPLQEVLPPGKPVALLMVAPSGMTATRELAAGFGGRIVMDRDALAAEADPAQTPLYEFTWNHTTLQVLKQDKTVTYLQSLFPAERVFESIAEMRAMFGDELLLHLEFIKFEGQVTCSGLQVVRYTTPERLDEIIRLHEAHGVLIANPHVYTVEDGSRHKRLPGDQLGFKHEVDPLNLLNPGKMRSVPMYCPLPAGGDQVDYLTVFA